MTASSVQILQPPIQNSGSTTTTNAIVPRSQAHKKASRCLFGAVDQVELDRFIEEQKTIDRERALGNYGLDPITEQLITGENVNAYKSLIVEVKEQEKCGLVKEGRSEKIKERFGDKFRVIEENTDNQRADATNEIRQDVKERLQEDVKSCTCENGDRTQGSSFKVKSSRKETRDVLSSPYSRFSLKCIKDDESSSSGQPPREKKDI